MLYVNFNDTNNILGVSTKPFGSLSFQVIEIEDTEEYIEHIVKLLPESEKKLLETLNEPELSTTIARMGRLAGEYLHNVQQELDNCHCD